MSEMVSDDVKNGMKLLMETLLPMVINKLKAQEQRIADLEAKLEATVNKPKRTRKKKSEADGATATAETASVPEDVSLIERLYEMSTGTKLDSVTIGTSSDGAAMTINGEVVTSDTMRAVQDAFAEYPTATVPDVANALNLSVLVVCYVAVTFKLYDFTA